LPTPETSRSDSEPLIIVFQSHIGLVRAAVATLTSAHADLNQRPNLKEHFYESPQFAEVAARPPSRQSYRPPEGTRLCHQQDSTPLQGSPRLGLTAEAGSRHYEAAHFRRIHLP
jgi:hypothetical protein